MPVLWAPSTGLLPRETLPTETTLQSVRGWSSAWGSSPLPPEFLATGVRSSPSVTGQRVTAPLRHGQTGSMGAVGVFLTLETLRVTLTAAALTSHKHTTRLTVLTCNPRATVYQTPAAAISPVAILTRTSACRQGRPATHAHPHRRQVDGFRDKALRWSLGDDDNTTRFAAQGRARAPVI